MKMFRTIAMVFLGFAVLAPAFAVPRSPLPPIRADQARANTGQNVTVRGVVQGNHRDHRLGQYLDLDSTGMLPVFAGYIPVGNQGQFPAFEELKGREVEMTGTIAMRHGYPIMFLTNKTQLRVVR